MMAAAAVLSYLLIAIIIFVGGFILGGLVYGFEGSEFLEKPGELLYNYQGLAGGLFTVFAAVTAYVAVQRQIASEEKRIRLAGYQRNGGMTMAISCLLIIAGAELRERPKRPLAPFIEQSLRGWIVDVARIDTRLGQALIQCVHEIDMDKETRQLQATDQDVVRGFAARCAVLSVAFRTAADAMLGERSVPAVLVPSEELIRIQSRFRINPSDPKSDLTWALIVSENWPLPGAMTNPATAANRNQTG